MRKTWRGIRLLVFACFGLLLAMAGDAAQDAKPRLVLVVSIDQMRYDYLVRFRGLFRRGLKELVEKGAVFTEARYRHACTETGPGHAVILSGRSPRYTGIVGNEWLDPVSRKVVNVVADPVQETLGGDAPAASPASFLGSSLGDVLKKASPASRVVGVSLKDRSAILMAGHRGDGAYWYSSRDGHFVTSTYYFRESPKWLPSFNARGLADGFAKTPWTRLLDDAALYEKYAGPDSVQGEDDGDDLVFPHELRAKPPAAAYYSALRETPFADTLTLEAALAAMDAHELGRRDAIDLLAVGFSATDVIGHAFGPDSQEIMDQILRLDALLGTLMDEVVRRVGPGRTLVVLTADHGVMPLPEVLVKRGIDARRIKAETLVRSVGEALAKRFSGATGLVHSDLPPHFNVDADALERLHLSRDEVEETVASALKATGLVEGVYTKRQLLGAAPPGDAQFSLFRNAFFEPRSADVIVSLKPYILLDDHAGGTGHGTAHDYDRHVPIVFWGPGIPAGSYPEPCGPEDIAPTLGRLLGLDYPPEDGARVLGELMSR